MIQVINKIKPLDTRSVQFKSGHYGNQQGNKFTKFTQATQWIYIVLRSNTTDLYLGNFNNVHSHLAGLDLTKRICIK